MNFFRLVLVLAVPLFVTGCGTSINGGGEGGDGGGDGGGGEGGGTCDTDNGCGHLDECPDSSDPTVHYLSEDPSQCGLTDCGGPETDCIPCGADQEYFQDDVCGCGCIDITPEPEPACPNPEDPAVHYISQDPAQCLETDCGGPETDCIPCGADQEYFDDDVCGCGCIDTNG